MPVVVALLGALGVAAPACGEVKRLSFPVSGLHSPLATRGVEQAIGTLPGVARVSADLSSGRVDVEAEEQKSLNIQDVRTRAAHAGFPVSGDLDVEARGRFEIGAERRITFKVSGTTYAWQVLESGTLLDLFRAYPTLRGDFVTGFRLHDGAAWTRPAISLTDWHLIPAQPLPRASSGSSLSSASPAAAAPPKPKPAKPAAKAAPAKPASTKSSTGETSAARPAVAKKKDAPKPQEPLTHKERREPKKKQQASETDKPEPGKP
jgi:copper chaperone CopZ